MAIFWNEQFHTFQGPTMDLEISTGYTTPCWRTVVICRSQSSTRELGRGATLKALLMPIHVDTVLGFVVTFRGLFP